MRAIAVAVLALLVLGCDVVGVPPRPSTDVPPAPVVTESDALQAVIAREPRLAGITPRDPDGIGQAAWYEVTPASGVGAFVVAVHVGWGDCQAGCIDEHTWLYAVGPDGTVTLQSEGGPPVPADAWPSPGSGTGATGLDLLAASGPSCPVETVPPQPGCAPRPVPGAVVAVRQGDAEVLRVTLDAGGRSFVELPPGDYALEAQRVEGLMGTPETTEVTVVQGEATSVELMYDTGLR